MPLEECAIVLRSLQMTDSRFSLYVGSHHHAAIDGLLRRRLIQLMTTVRYLRVWPTMKDSPISNALLAARQDMSRLHQLRIFLCSVLVIAA